MFKVNQSVLTKRYYHKPIVLTHTVFRLSTCSNQPRSTTVSTSNSMRGIEWTKRGPENNQCLESVVLLGIIGSATCSAWNEMNGVVLDIQNL